MCIPMMAVALIGAAISAGAAVKQGSDARTAANYNADAQRKTAISVENQGAQAAAEKKDQMRKIESKQVVAAAAGGLRTDTGTPLTLAGETAAFGELDALRITNNAQRSAWGYQTQAGLDEFQGRQAKSSGFLSAGGSLLSGASSAYYGSQKLAG